MPTTYVCFQRATLDMSVAWLQTEVVKIVLDRVKWCGKIEFGVHLRVIFNGENWENKTDRTDKLWWLKSEANEERCIKGIKWKAKGM